MTTASMRKEFYRLARLELEKLGFRKRSMDYVAELSKGFDGVVVLAHVTYRMSEVDFGVTVGVRDAGLDKVLIDTLGYTHPFAVGQDLGYATPDREYKTYDVMINGVPSLAVSCMIEDLRDFGIPWMNEMSNRTSIIKGLERDFPNNATIGSKFPVLLWLEGEVDRARECLEIARKSRDGRDDPEALKFREFASKLENLMDS